MVSACDTCERLLMNRNGFEVVLFHCNESIFRSMMTTVICTHVCVALKGGGVSFLSLLPSLSPCCCLILFNSVRVYKPIQCESRTGVPKLLLFALPLKCSMNFTPTPPEYVEVNTYHVKFSQ
jgi:hypothetical protein